MFCNKCEGEVEAVQEEPSGYLVCTACGNVLDHSAWSTDPTFTKEGGESTVAGHFVSNNAGSHGLARFHGGRMSGLVYNATEKASIKGRDEINKQVVQLGIRPRDDVINSAHRLYMLAVQHNFTRGRRIAQVAAACIYIICRQDKHPFMLLDFSDVLQVNVFVLGAVFLQLCRVLRLETHPIMTRPVDPSLYLHRFADRLGFGKKMHQVANTALRLVSSMKRDWLQTGRRPGGICGAALYIAGHVHGFQLAKADVIRVVHVGESTLDKRVAEFADTAAGALTVVEFEDRSRQIEDEEQLQIDAMEPLPALPAPDGPVTHGCEHLRAKQEGVAMFAHGMCKECYLEFLKVTGGLHQPGANPPSFQANLEGEAARMRLEQEVHPALPAYSGEGADEDDDGSASDTQLAAEVDSALADDNLNALAQALVPAGSEPPKVAVRKRKKRQRASKPSEPAAQKRKRSSTGMTQQAASRGGASQDGASQEGAPQQGASPSGVSAQHAATSGTIQPEDDQAAVVPPAGEDANPCRDIVATEDASQGRREEEILKKQDKETLSDLSEEEIDNYFHTKEEAKLKGVLWTAMNQDYIEKQALKAALATNSKEAEEATVQPQLEPGGKRARGRPKGSKSKPRPEDNMEPAQSAEDGVRKMLTARKLSSKINYANLDSLFEGSTVLASTPSTQSPLPSAPEPAAGGSQAAAAGPAPKQQAPKAKRPPASKPPVPKPPARSGASATPTPGKTPKLRSSSLGGIGLLSPAKRSTLAPLPNSLS